MDKRESSDLEEETRGEHADEGTNSRAASPAGSSDRLRSVDAKAIKPAQESRLQRLKDLI